MRTGSAPTPPVAIEVREVLVVRDRLVVGLDAEVLAERGGERRLAGADHPGDADEDVAEHLGLRARRRGRRGRTRAVREARAREGRSRRRRPARFADLGVHGATVPERSDTALRYRRPL